MDNWITLDVEDGIGRRMVVSRRPPVRLDPERLQTSFIPTSATDVDERAFSVFMFPFYEKDDESWIFI